MTSHTPPKPRPTGSGSNVHRITCRARTGDDTVITVTTATLLDWAIRVVPELLLTASERPAAARLVRELDTIDAHRTHHPRLLRPHARVLETLHEALLAEEPELTRARAFIGPDTMPQRTDAHIRTTATLFKIPKLVPVPAALVWADRVCDLLEQREWHRGRGPHATQLETAYELAWTALATRQISDTTP
ncbi:hypothetical protein ASF48_17645 [Rathayibacter sp. Leaf299]|uniref:hypothetical protein n=1 Tax=Rathayibacter sp. Leaf299 TaxID=1736328 RepID=UPI0006FF650E|nr:hypothetical protein [Rathayibacter sp. Leaf299]KQQ18743.1 hypothetical protein ASF48_17645 [Rathayibacter sp. Leaf299]